MACESCKQKNNNLTIEEALKNCSVCPVIEYIDIDNVKVLRCGKTKNTCVTVYRLGNGCPNSLWGILTKPNKDE